MKVMIIGTAAALVIAWSVALIVSSQRPGANETSPWNVVIHVQPETEAASTLAATVVQIAVQRLVQCKALYRAYPAAWSQLKKPLTVHLFLLTKGPIQQRLEKLEFCAYTSRSRMLQGEAGVFVGHAQLWPTDECPDSMDALLIHEFMHVLGVMHLKPEEAAKPGEVGLSYEAFDALVKSCTR